MCLDILLFVLFYRTIHSCGFLGSASCLLDYESLQGWVMSYSFIYLSISYLFLASSIAPYMYLSKFIDLNYTSVKDLQLQQKVYRTFMCV